MTVLEAIVLGAVQGLTEFFPVSSSGHLVLTQSLLGLSLPGLSFDVALHVATLVSVVFVYRARIFQLIRGLGGRDAWVFIAKLVLATLPAAIVGLLFKDWFEARFDDPRFAGTMLLVTGTVVWSSRWALGRAGAIGMEVLPLLLAVGVSLRAGTVVPFLAVGGVLALIMGVSRLTVRPGDRESQHIEPGWATALAMGIAQAVAIIPGITRSGSTVVTGLWRRFDPVAAAEFSFLMSIPAILGAAVLSLPELAAGGDGPGGVQLMAGAVAAALAGIAAIRFFVGMLRRRSFHLFAYYCWVAGAAFLLTR
jgi:undecaprenyl-diphosphatase